MFRNHLVTCALGLALAVLAVLAAAAPASAHNFLVIVLDDIGVDYINVYSRDDLYGHPGEGANPGPTPNIDALALRGVLFRNAWATPNCSASRALLLTGRFGFRTGIGTPGNTFLELSETTLPELLSATHLNGAYGKWHIGGSDEDHPNDSGFTDYAGHLGANIVDYFSWDRTANGSTTPDYAIYGTTDNVDGALAAIQGFGSNPWIVWVAFNAPHRPFHVPPDSLHTHTVTSSSPTPDLYTAMVEAADTEIGRLLANIPAGVADSTTIFLLGDNGTPNPAVQPPFISGAAKATVYEGGVNVPFLVAGPNVDPADEGSESLALVSAADLFATIAEIAGVTSTAEDSHSLVPYLEDPSLPTLASRPYAYTEQFSPNGPGPYTEHERAIRNETYKLIWRDGVYEEFFHLVDDRWEQSNLLLGPLDPDEQLAYDELVAAMESIQPTGTSGPVVGPAGSGPLEVTAHPNPFVAAVTLAFTLPTAGEAELTIHDAAGRRVATVLEGRFAAGLHSAQWTPGRAGSAGGAIASGSYFYWLRTADGMASGKVALVR